MVNLKHHGPSFLKVLAHAVPSARNNLSSPPWLSRVGGTAHSSDLSSNQSVPSVTGSEPLPRSLLPGKHSCAHFCEGQRGLARWHPWGHKELDRTERLNNNDHTLLRHLLNNPPPAPGECELRCPFCSPLSPGTPEGQVLSCLLNG